MVTHKSLTYACLILFISVGSWITTCQHVLRIVKQSNAFLLKNSLNKKIVMRSFLWKSVSNGRCLLRCMSSSAKNLERKSFGSFHSEDIEVLIRQSDADFKPPAIANAIQDKVSNIFSSDIEAFSNHSSIDTRKNLFAIDPSWTFINHGAFGGALRPVLHAASLWREHCEAQPLRFYDRELFPLIAYNLREMAKVIHCDAVNLMPLANVTTGINAILNTHIHALKPGDEILCLSLTYGSTKKMLHDAAARAGCTVQIVPLTLPVHSTGNVLHTARQYISTKTKLVILDDITSNTAMQLPVLALAKMCKEINPSMIVVIDAAHSLFSQHIQLQSPVSTSSNAPMLTEYEKYVDYYVTNGHKWLSAPKGCALLWCNPHSIHHLRPAIISHGFTTSIHSKHLADRNHFLSAFAWDGCRDYAAFLSLASAVQIWDSLAQQQSSVPPHSATARDRPWDVFRNYMCNLLDDAEELLFVEWRLQLTDFACSYNMRARSPMRLVPLPCQLMGKSTSKHCVDRDAFSLQELLHHEHRIEVPVKCLEGRLYVRISAHLYNSIKDYERLAHAIKGLM